MPEVAGDYVPKARYYDRAEDRIGAYRDWRYKLGDHLYVCDFDQAEYRVVNDDAEVVGLIEVTMCRTTLEANGLLDKIWARLDPDSDGRSHLQTQAMRNVARRLNIPAIVVVHQVNGNRFAVRRFDSHDEGWKKYEEAGYQKVLRWMRTRYASVSDA